MKKNSVFIYDENVVVVQNTCEGLKEYYIPIDELDKTWINNDIVYSYWICELQHLPWFNTQLMEELGAFINNFYTSSNEIDWQATYFKATKTMLKNGAPGSALGCKDANPSMPAY